MVTFELHSFGPSIVQLTVTHDWLESEMKADDPVNGWPAILSNLKSVLETDRTLPFGPWKG